MRGLGIWSTILLAGCLLTLLVPPALATDTCPVSQAQISEGRWAPNVRVNDDSGTAWQGQPSLAVDPDGNAYAVWSDVRSGAYEYDIYFSYRPVGGSWGPNVKVNDDPGTRDQWNPSIAVDSSGNAYAVWEDERYTGFAATSIYFSYRPAGGSWGPNSKVDDAQRSSEVDPSIAVDSHGNGYAVWTDYRHGDANIYFSYRPAGGDWGANVMINDDPPGLLEREPSIAVDPAGNASAVWQDRRNGWLDPDIYSSYRPAGGSWTANVRVNDDSGMFTQRCPSVAVDPSGNVYAVWRDYRPGSTVALYFSHRLAAASWDPNIRVDDAPGGAFVRCPSIAVDLDGDAYALWPEFRSTPWDIYFSHRPAAGAWGQNLRVNDQSGTGQSNEPLSIAADSSGKGYAVWSDLRNGDSDIYFSYWPSYLLGGIVWYDADEDGIHDSEEPGVENIDVTLYNNGTCAVPSSTMGTTAPDGSYDFAIEVAGTYCVEFSGIPDNWTITMQDQGADDTADSDANPASAQIQNIVVPPERDVLHEDVGLYEVGPREPDEDREPAEEFVPEPATLALLCSGLAGAAGYAALRRRS